jgi:hypothetical protein
VSVSNPTQKVTILHVTLWTLNLKVPVCQLIPWYPKRTPFVCSQASPNYLSDKSSFKVNVSIEIWWNNTHKGKSKYTEKTPLQNHLVNHNFTRTGPRSNWGLRGDRPTTALAMVQPVRGLLLVKVHFVISQIIQCDFIRKNNRSTLTVEIIPVTVVIVEKHWNRVCGEDENILASNFVVHIANTRL